MPQTSYILDMIKAVITTRNDPSKMASDPVEGLKIKEIQLKKITHELLQQNVPNYEEAEAKVAATLGDKFIPLMLGLLPPETIGSLLPTITFSNFIPFYGSSSSSSSSSDGNIHAGVQYYLESLISGGTTDLSSYDYEWIIVKQPIPGEVIFTEYSSTITPTEWNLITLVEFSNPGFYLIQLKITNRTNTSLIAIQTATATVIA